MGGIMADKNQAADRVIATLSRDPELLEAVRDRMGLPNSMDFDFDEETLLDQAIDLLEEGTLAFQRFCELNNIRRAVFGVGDPEGKNRNPKAKVWRKFMRDDAIPRNITAAKLLVTFFEGHLPPEVKEFCDYVDEYRDLITDWDNEVPNAPHTTNRNFPAGFDAFLKTVQAEHNRQLLVAAKKALQGPHMTWAVLMIEHEFGQRDEGWTLFATLDAAKDWRAEKNKGSSGAPGQYFSYETPIPMTVDHAVWTRLSTEGELHSRGNKLPAKGTVVSMELIR
jgi:hypothetical protein